jgi:hypothetical protein
MSRTATPSTSRGNSAQPEVSAEIASLLTLTGKTVDDIVTARDAGTVTLDPILVEELREEADRIAEAAAEAEV